MVDATSGKTVGEIHSVDDSTINTLFELVTANGDDILIPASDELITSVDTEHRQLTMQLPEACWIYKRLN